jgi:1-acyl-sn-glycerol-3-phosphate acyltransferase
MKRIFYLLYQLYKWFIYLPILAITTAVSATLVLILMFFLDAGTVSRLCGTPWARILSYAIPMLVTRRGRENIRKQQSYVIVSNHQSQCDIMVIYGWMGVDFKWVMKQELRKVPFIGIACEKLGHIFIDRSNRNAALASLNAARERIVNGTSVFFFPEGTRNPTGEPLPFKKGAFRMALDLGLPILPITITGTREILPTRTRDLFPGRAEMIIHPPIEVTGHGEADLGKLMDTARAVIQSGLES